MQLIELIIGTVLLVLLFIKLTKSSNYDSYVEQLDDSEYPLKSFYGIGFAWNDGKLLNLRGKPKQVLMAQAKLLYDPQYSEYYATVVWAQVITFVHLILCAGFILAGAFNFSFFTLVAVVFAVIMGYYFYSKMKTEIENRKTECVVELPEIVSTMALLMNSGMMLREAWEKIAHSKDGAIYELMRSASVDMQNGMPEIDAIHKFGILTDSSDVKKFTSALIQGIEKGSRELSSMLTKQSSEMWNLKKQIMLQKGEAAASKLLIPIALIFVGILIVVVSAAIGMLI